MPFNIFTAKLEIWKYPIPILNLHMAKEKGNGKQPWSRYHCPDTPRSWNCNFYSWDENTALSFSNEDRGPSSGLLDSHCGPHCHWKYSQILQPLRQQPLSSGTFWKGSLTKTSCVIEIIQVTTEWMVTSPRFPSVDFLFSHWIWISTMSALDIHTA